jgi:hypothetical protein
LSGTGLAKGVLWSRKPARPHICGVFAHGRLNRLCHLGIAADEFRTKFGEKANDVVDRTPADPLFWLMPAVAAID